MTIRQPEKSRLPRGVIFSSYSSLIAAAKTGEKRLDQIQRWLGSDGVVIFDEAHKAKNALAGGRWRTNPHRTSSH